MSRHACEDLTFNERLLRLNDSDVKICGLLDVQLRLVSCLTDLIIYHLLTALSHVGR